MADANVAAPAGGRRRQILLLTGVVLVVAGSAVAVAPVALAGQSPGPGLACSDVDWIRLIDPVRLNLRKHA